VLKLDTVSYCRYTNTLPEKEGMSQENKTLKHGGGSRAAEMEHCFWERQQLGPLLRQAKRYNILP